MSDDCTMVPRLALSPQLAAQLRETPVVLTGCSGWLGQAVLEMLDGIHGARLASWVHVFGSSERPITLRSGRMILCQPLGVLANLTIDAPLMLHCAFLTKDKVAATSLSNYVRQNTEIADMVCDAARRLRAGGVFLPSSGAVYNSGGILEDDLERNPYGTLKLRDEARFAKLTEETGARLSIARIFNLSGPFINKFTIYALSSIILDILAGRPIVLKADYPVIRSYTHVRDVLELALRGLLVEDALMSSPFDTAGAEEIEMSALASRVAEVLGHPGWPIERPALRGAPINRYVGDPTKIRSLARRAGIHLAGLPEQIRDTADYLVGHFEIHHQMPGPGECLVPAFDGAD